MLWNVELTIQILKHLNSKDDASEQRDSIGVGACVVLHTVCFTMSERSCMELGEGTVKQGQWVKDVLML